MAIKTSQITDLSSDKTKKPLPKNGTTAPAASMTEELGLKVCPISERIIKETSIKWRKAMEMLADL